MIYHGPIWSFQKSVPTQFYVLGAKVLVNTHLSTQIGLLLQEGTPLDMLFGIT